MTDVAPVLHREARALRAVLFALAVLAQLLLPAIVLRAEAAVGDLCFGQDDHDSTGKSKAHPHEQQCAHCRFDDASPVVPPADVTIARIAPIQSGYAVPAPLDLPVSTTQRSQPPPTGPPLA